MDRALYNQHFTKKNIPGWICPTCNTSALKLVDGSLITKETSSSKEAHAHPAWDPDWTRLRFSCMFECSNPGCSEVVSCCGDGVVDWEQAYEHGDVVQKYYDYLEPKFFSPPLKLFQIPEDTPEEVYDLLINSFSMAFSNSAAAANQARNSVEAILTYLKVKRFNTTKGRRNRINLHSRIELLPSKYEKVKDLLIAVKLVGNAGSHDEKKPVCRESLFDTYEIIEVVLHELFDDKRSRTESLAKRIVKKKGPVR